MKRHASLLSAVLLGFALLSYAQAPVPFINLPLIPDATPPGGPQFTLTVNGTGFVSNSTVNWNGTPLVTQFVSQSQLTATVPAANIATASTGWVTVVNPAPGGGTSNTAYFTVTANVGNAVGFAVTSSPGTGWLPYSVAAGDFNGDGKLDLAVADCGVPPNYWYCYFSNPPSTLSILLGDGTGNFTLASSPAVGVDPLSVAVGDFNGDGKLDLAVANEGSNTVSILLGDGTGNFTLASSPVTGYSPVSVAVGDFNGDGKLDLAVANNGSNTVSILLGDGTGNFTLASSPATGEGPNSVAVGDFNGDGKLDLAVANWNGNTVSILLGDGAGNFTLASSPATGVYPESVAVGDFNGDGKLDLAVANGGSDTVSILLGDGTGNFTLASSPAVGSAPASLAAGDFNGDGKLDLAVTNECGNDPSCQSGGTVSILLGDGTGNFKLAMDPGAGAYPRAMAAGDFSSDGKLDLAVTNPSYDTVSIMLQVPPYPIATLSPGSLTFGPQVIRTHSSPQDVTLSNTGTAALNISSIVASSNFFQENNCGSSLAAGASCTIAVVFRPTRSGTITGTIAITDNAPNSPQTVALSGTGEPNYPTVVLSPTSLVFATQLVGTTSSPQNVTLSNTGYVPLDIASIVASGNFAQTNNCGSVLAAGGSCTIAVTFDPQQIFENRGRITITDNAPNSPQIVPLTGAGTYVMLLPSSLNFGDQKKGTTSPPQYVTLTNTAGQTLTINSIRITGGQSQEFAQTNNCPATLPPEGNCTISVTFTPVWQHGQSATLEAKDDGGASPQTVSLSGTGTQ